MNPLVLDKATAEKVRAGVAGEFALCDENGQPLGWVATRASHPTPAAPPLHEDDDGDWPSEEELERRARGPSVPSSEVVAMLRKLRETHR